MTKFSLFWWVGALVMNMYIYIYATGYKTHGKRLKGGYNWRAQYKEGKSMTKYYNKIKFNKRKNNM